MGLDIVELLMAVEDEFGIEFAEADAEKVAVLGEMHASIVRALRMRGETPDEGAVWKRLRDLVVEQLGVLPEAVMPRAHLVDDLGAN